MCMAIVALLLSTKNDMLENLVAQLDFSVETSELNISKSNIIITKLDPTSRSNFDTVMYLWASFTSFQTNIFPLKNWSDLDAANAEAMAQLNGGAIVANTAALGRATDSAVLQMST